MESKNNNKADLIESDKANSEDSINKTDSIESNANNSTSSANRFNEKAEAIAQEPYSASAAQEQNKSTKKPLVEPARLWSAAAMIIAVILVLVFHSPFVIWLVLGVACAVGFYEAYALFCASLQTTMQNERKSPNAWEWAAFGFSWLGAFFWESLSGWLLVCLALASFTAYTKRGNLERFASFLYPLLPFLFLYFLYLEYSVNALLWLIFVVALADAGAYFGGKMFGGKFFADSAFCATSPNKTKEGAVCGVGAAVLVGSFVGLGVCDFAFSFILSVCVAIAAVFGDLFESYLKRSAGVKDSGKIFPGHGGMLDRMDGYFFGGVMLYLGLDIARACGIL